MVDGQTKVENPPSAKAVPVSRYFLFVTIAIVGCAADLLTKSAIFRWRGMPGESPIWWIWDGIFGIETALNTGALFGIGQNKVLFFAAFSFLALAGILVWFSWAKAGRDLFLTIVLACVTGGILGNLNDRLGFWEPTSLSPEAGPMVIWPEHAVRDWIRLSYGEHVWPNFNVADCLLVVGASMLVWHSFRAPKTAPSSASRSTTMSAVKGS
jgi:signal peptidase II